MKKDDALGTTPCADPAFLRDFLLERLDEREEARVQEHVGTCDACQRALETAAGDAALWQDVREILPTDAPASDDAASLLREVQACLAPSDDPEMLGRLGHYEIRGIIGSGSTGIVLKALEPRLNRYVAIKLLSPIYRTSGPARQRFAREARAIAAVSHEHVVPIHSVDEYEGLPYLVMQYVPGISLQQRIDRDGPLDSFEVARLGLQIARALAAAHAQGIVHRDVKPANVILEDTVDRALVTDFGLARVADEVTMTHTGTITGTPQYMSPEQARGDTVDARSDLFSLGSLLYAACTGHPPFRAQTLFGVIRRVCESEPRPIRESNPTIDEWIAALIEQLMQKDTSARLQDAPAVAAAFEAELARLQNPTTTPRPERRWHPSTAGSGRPPQRWLLTAAGLAFFGGATWLAAGMFQEGEGNGDGDSSHAAMFGDAGNQQQGDRWLRLTENGVTRWERRITEAYPVGDNKKMQLDLAIGDVTLDPAEDGSVKLELVRAFTTARLADAKRLDGGHELRAWTEDGVMHFRSTATADARGRLFYRLTIPGSLATKLRTDHGGVRLGALAGDVDARAQDGDIEAVSGCTGTLELLAIRGDIRTAKIGKYAKALTSGGDIHLGKSKGYLYAQTSGGHIYIDGVDGATGGFATGGDVIARVPESPKANCRFSAAGGDVTVFVGADVAVDLAARGEIESPFEREPVAGESEAEAPWSLSRLNGGGKRIRLVSSSGAVTIKKLDANSPPLGGSYLGGSSLSGSGLGGSGTGGSGLGGSGPGGSGTGGSGLSGSGLSGSGLGGSGRPSAPSPSAAARAKMRGAPRPGAFVPVRLPTKAGSLMDGYTVYLPLSHGKKDTKHPVLVYLQGGYGVGGDIVRVNDWGLARLIRDESDPSTKRNRMLLDTFIVVCPHIVEGNFDREPDIVRGILDTILEKYDGDPSRIYLTGLSRGGHGTWGLATKLPNTFAAICPIGGNSSAVRDWQVLKNTSIWISHNRGDGIIDFANAQTALDKLEGECGAEFRRFDGLLVAGTDFLRHRHILTSARTDSHDAWTEVYSRPEFYEWLLQQRLPQKKSH